MPEKQDGSGAPEKAPQDIFIELDGEKRKLYYDLNALIAF